MVLQYPFTEGLKPKLSYDQLMNTILDGGVIKAKKGTTLYDNRFFNDTFEMSKFRMMNLLDLEKLEENMRKQEMMRNEAKNLSRETGIPAHVINNEMRNEERKTKVINFDLHDGDIFNDAYEEAKDEAMGIEKEEEEKRAENVRKVKTKITSNLLKAIPKTIGQKLARERNKTIKEKLNEVEMEDPDYIDPMVVNDEETQQKRGYESNGGNPKKKKKKERKKELRVMQLEEEADIKRRKIEKEREEEEMKKSKERSDASFEKTRQEIKALEEKKAANDKLKLLKAEIKNEKTRNRLNVQGLNAAPPLPLPGASSSSRDTNVKGNRGGSDVEVGEIKPNKNKTMKYWKEQSANELRNQLKLRDLQKFKDEWAFKNKEQLLDIIKDLIKDKKW